MYLYTLISREHRTSSRLAPPEFLHRGRGARGPCLPEDLVESCWGRAERKKEKKDIHERKKIEGRRWALEKEGVNRSGRGHGKVRC